MNTTTFHLRALCDGVRLSGRSLDGRRDIKVTCGPTLGQVCVWFGKTFVSCVVDAAIVTPAPERPNEGSIYISARSPTLEMEKQSKIASLIERLIRGSRIVDPGALCILSGKKVWSLRLGLRILHDDGNVIDACSMAALGALMHFRKAEVTLKGSEATLHEFAEREPLPLPLIHHPFCVTFAVVDVGTAKHKIAHATKAVQLAQDLPQKQLIVLVDPDSSEEEMGSALLTIAANVSGDICLVHKGGGSAISTSVLNACLNKVKAHVQEMSQILTNALNQTVFVPTPQRLQLA